MKFINAQEFLKQPKEAQEVFLDWWKPEFGDLYCNLYNGQENTVLVINKCQMEMATFVGDIKIFGVPLLTESQLIQFIEEKTNHKLELYLDCNEKYTVMLCRDTYFKYDTNETILLQALWQVAYKIAQEEINKKGELNK